MISKKSISILPSEIIKEIPSDELKNSHNLLALKQKILAVEDSEDRHWLLYYLVTRMLDEGLWNKAEDFVGLMEAWPIEQSWFLGDIASEMWNQGEILKAKIIFDKGIVNALKSGRPWQQSEALLRLAKNYIRINEQKFALELLLQSAEIAKQGERESFSVNDMQSYMDSSSVLMEIAETIGTLGEIDKAMQTANSIENIARRKSAIKKIQNIGV